MKIINYVSAKQFSSTFESTSENSRVLSERYCVSARLEHNRYLVAGLLNSDLLAVRFDLSQSFVTNLEIYFKDFSDKKLGETLEVYVFIQGLPDLLIPFSQSSPLKQFFENEYKIGRFGKGVYRRSAYTELIRKMEKKKKRLLFDAILEYTAINNSGLGEGLVTIKINLPNYNHLIGYLEESGYLK